MLSHHNVDPQTPAAAYLGGKRNLARQIVALINEIPHASYIEPFVGMGGVFLRRTKRPPCEVINDLNGEIANFFRVLQRHHKALVEELTYQIPSRKTFYRLRDTDPATLTDLERAARFYYLQRLAFGGKVKSQAFGVQRMGNARLNMPKLTKSLDTLHHRLAGVVIECLPYDELIARYDHKAALFYLDPPYYGNESDYGKGLFTRTDFAKMADQLACLKGTFLLSLNDKPQVRETFQAFHQIEVQTTYSIHGSNKHKAGELIITNWEGGT